MFKSRGEGLVPTQYDDVHTNCGPIDIGKINRLSNGWIETSAGVSIPGFYKKKQLAAESGRLLPMTPWAQTYTSFSGYDDWSLYLVINPCNRYEAHATGVPDLEIPEPPTVLVPPDNRDLLTQQAIATLYKEGWDAGTFFAQFNKSVDTVVGLAQRLYKLWKTGKLSIADMGNPVSELAWAWRPMLYDLEDLSNLLAELGSDRSGKVWRKHVGATETHSESRQIASTNNGLYDTLVTETWDVIYSERVTVHSMIAPPRFFFDPLVTGWESIPFSFVLDKLIDIGAFLASFSGRIWHQDLQLAYGTQQTLYYHYLREYTGPGSFAGSNVQSYTKVKVQTNRQPTDATAWLPKLTATPLKAQNLMYYIELMRKLKR